MEKNQSDIDRLSKLEESSESDSSSDSSSGNSESSDILSEKRKSFKEKIEYENPIIDKLKNSKNSVKIYSILSCLKLSKLHLVLQLCKKVYSGKLSQKIKKKHMDFFKTKKQQLDDTLYGIKVSKLRRKQTLDILKIISSENDGKLFRKLIYYKKYCK